MHFFFEQPRAPLSTGRVVRGTELLGAGTKSQGNALIQGTVPAAWAAVWEGPEAPVPWMKARYTQDIREIWMRARAIA